MITNEKNSCAKFDLQAQMRDPNRIRDFLRFEQNFATTVMEYKANLAPLYNIYWPFALHK